MSKYVDPYPRWYTAVKWLVPLSLAIGSGLVVGLAILGILPIPFAFGKLAWLPAVYASLDTMKAVVLLGIGTTAVSAIVGLATAFLLRATVLFQVNEMRGTQGQSAQQRIEDLEKVINHLHQLQSHNDAAKNAEFESSLEDEREDSAFTPKFRHKSNLNDDNRDSPLKMASNDESEEGLQLQQRSKLRKSLGQS